MTGKELKIKFPNIANKYKNIQDDDIIFSTGTKLKILKRIKN